MQNFKLLDYYFGSGDRFYTGLRYIALCSFDCKDDSTRSLLDIAWTSNRLCWLDILWFRVWG